MPNSHTAGACTCPWNNDYNPVNSLGHHVSCPTLIRTHAPDDSCRRAGVEGAGHEDALLSTLPPFPVDDATLDLLWAAMHPDPEVFEASRVGNFLQFMSQLGGSDTDAVAEGIEDGSDGGPAIHVMRDPQYHEHTVMTALIEEIRRLRARQVTG